MKRFVLPEYLTLKETEIFFYENRADLSTYQDIRLDMRDVNYIETGSFIYFLSFFIISKKKGKNVTLKLPESIHVRNIFRLWRFPTVLKELIDIPFKDIVDENDLIYFGESNIASEYLKNLADNEEGLIRLLEQNFFSLYNLPFDTDKNKKDTLINESKKWENIFIKAVLMKHLKKYDNINENLIPRVIIYECLTNAFRHPNSDFLITGSFYDKKSKSFTINYWDNGNSIFSTLKQAILSDKNIKAKFDEVRFENLFSTFYIKFVHGDKTIITFQNSNQIPDKTSNDYEILLSSFFPGISRDPDGSFNYFKNEEIDVNSPGMGLTYLLMVVVAKLEGMLSVRTKNYFINFSIPNKIINSEIDDIENNGNKIFKNRYKCKIEYFPGSDSYFEGNMVTIRLPLN